MRPSRRQAALLLGVAFLPLLALYMPAMTAPGVGVFHDDGVYAVTAKSLAEGRGYRIASLPEEIPQTKYPILFPFALSILWRVHPEFPANSALLRLVPLLAGLLWCAIVFRLFEREAGRAPALALVWLTLASPWVFFLSTSLMSETTFAAFCWGSLSVLRSIEDDSASRRAPVLAGVLAAAAVLTRTIGVVVVVAGVLSLAAGRRRAAALRFGAVAVGLVLPWLAWAQVQASHVTTGGYYSYENYAGWNVLFNFAWIDKFTVVAANALSALFAPAWIQGAGPGGGWALPLAIAGLTTFGFVVHASRRVTVLHWFFALYVAVVLLWAWPTTRFLVPVYPMLLLFAWTGLVTLLDGFSLETRARRAAVAVSLAASAVVSLAGLAGVSAAAAREGTVWPMPHCSTAWSGYREAIDWIRENTEESSVVAANLDPMVYLYAGRKADRAFTADPIALYYDSQPHRRALGPASALGQRLMAANADYLVDLPASCFAEAPMLRRQIDELRVQRPGALETVAFPVGREARIFRVRRSLLGATDRSPPLRPR